MPAQILELSPAQSGLAAPAAGSSIPVGTASMGVVAVNITAASGTTPKLTLWCEWSPDNVSWFMLFHGGAGTCAATVATDITATTDKRNIVTEVAAAAMVTALYPFLPNANIRLRWIISGTTPAFSWDAVKMHVK